MGWGHEPSFPHFSPLAPARGSLPGKREGLIAQFSRLALSWTLQSQLLSPGLGGILSGLIRQLVPTAAGWDLQVVRGVAGWWVGVSAVRPPCMFVSGGREGRPSPQVSGFMAAPPSRFVKPRCCYRLCRFCCIPVGSLKVCPCPGQRAYCVPGAALSTGAGAREGSRGHRVVRFCRRARVVFWTWSCWGSDPGRPSAW